MIKVILSGCNSKMGQTLSDLIIEDLELDIVAGIDVRDDGRNAYPVFTDINACDVEADCIILLPGGSADKLLDHCVERKIPYVLCTMDLNKKQLQKVTCLLNPDIMFQRTNLFLKLLKAAVRMLVTKEADMDNAFENNQVTVMGEVISEFTFSYEVYGEAFYMVDIKCPRPNSGFDIIPIMMSEKLLDVTGNYMGMPICVKGKFRSYHRFEEPICRLQLAVFAREIELIQNLNVNSSINQIYLDGYIGKEPVYRKTPLGREIAELLLAVKRPYGKADYIPCICRGRNARYANNFKVGDHCAIRGRIQSREYIKKWDEENVEHRTAYEVEVCELELL